MYVGVNSSGEVRVNWKEVTKTSLTLKTGDVVSVRGKGRIQVISDRVNLFRSSSGSMGLTD